MRFQSQIGQLGVFRVVVMLFRLDARIGDMFDTAIDAKGFWPPGGNEFGQLLER